VVGAFGPILFVRDFAIGYVARGVTIQFLYFHFPPFTSLSTGSSDGFGNPINYHFIW
jgi:hypothetical protein